MRTGKDKALLIVFVFFVLALGARLALMELRPLHHDEGVNGHFVSNIVEGKGWNYDAENYHGPTLFYITAISFLAFGGSVFALRIVPVLFGSLLVFLPYLFRKKLGCWGLAAGCFALAFSPALLYYSMFAIHEILFAFFAVFSLAFLLKFVGGKKPWMLFSGTVCLALLFATKEAGFFIGSFVLLLFLGYAFLNRKALLGVIGRKELALWAAVSVAVFFLLYAALFTSFFTNFNGLEDSVGTLFLWGQRVIEEKGHEKPFQYYAEIMLHYELPLLLGGVAGIALAFRLREKMFVLLGVFFALVFFGISLVPYKTPWIAINFLPVLALLSGFLAGKMFEKIVWKIALAVLIVAFVGVLWSAYYVNVLVPEDGAGNRLCYVQTTFLAGEALDRVARAEGKICIAIESGSTWPIPWLLRGKEVQYCDSSGLENEESLREFRVVIVDREHGEKAGKALAGYERKEFDLRPGMPLTAFYSQNNGLTP